MSVPSLFAEGKVIRRVSQVKRLGVLLSLPFSLTLHLLELKGFEFSFIAGEKTGFREGRRRDTNRGQATSLPAIVMSEPASVTQCPRR